MSGQGALNALAVRFLTGRYIILYGELLDLMLKRGEIDEVKMIIGHELAHHSLGHVNILKNLLLFPARIIPFLGAAYGRACELSADRVGMMLCGKPEAAKKSLLALTLGSEVLTKDVNIEAFREQEHNMPPIMGFIYEIYATHPRMTKRITELIKFETHMYKQNSYSVPLN
jgi:Zn-dependent protease with chaperone function